MEDLTQKVCRACEGHEKPLDEKQIAPYLDQVPKWKVINDNKEIEREFEFEDFKEAIDFINKVATLAETEGHHPDLLLHNYKKVKITLSTHAIKGLSENDFIEAAKIDKLVE